MNGEIGVSDILINDAPVAAIVSDRIYIDKPRQGAHYPLIIIENRNVDPIISKSGVSETDIDIIGVLLYHTSRSGLKTLVEAVRSALDHKASGTYNTVEIQQLIFTSQSNFKEEETNREIYVADQEYRLRVGV